MRRRPRDSFAKRDHQVPDHFIAMTAGVTDLQPMLPFVIQQDCENIVRDDPLDVIRHRRAADDRDRESPT